MKTIFEVIGIVAVLLLLLGGGQCSVSIKSKPISEKEAESSRLIGSNDCAAAIRGLK